MSLNYLADVSSASITDTISWALAGVIVLVGLFILGMRDLLRFSPKRIWAISGVAFDESIRRRVLWIIPLAALGIIAVAQFTRAPDPQDAIRQSTKIALFATGVVVMVTAIILSCTSLPKEIENRVIFTIVTKPTTRLEIVLGKIVGFARVSGLILIIMGLFTIGFLKLQEAKLLATNNARLQDPGLDPAGRPAMEYYKAAGLLGTKSMEVPDIAQVMAQPRSGGFNEQTRMLGGESQFYVVAFDLTQQQRDQVLDVVSKDGWVYFETRFSTEYREPTAQEAKVIAELNLPTTVAPGSNGVGPLPIPGSSITPTLKGRPIPQVMLKVLNAREQQIVDAKEIGSRTYLLAQYEQQQSPTGMAASAKKAAGVSPNVSPDEDGAARAYVAPPKGVQALVDAGRFYVEVYGATPAVDYLIGARPTTMVLADATGRPVLTVDPAPRVRPTNPSIASFLAIPPPGSDPAAPTFLSNPGRYGYQILGREDGKGAVAAYHFVDAEVPNTVNGEAAFEVRIGLEGSSVDYAPDSESVVRMSMQVHNAKTGETSDPIPFSPESNRITPVRVPVKFVSSGEFDVYVRALTESQYVGMTPTAVTLVTAERSFAANLAKSLATLWMMSILVIAIGVFCSTWLSWPIAIVLTLLLLLGRWGVVQIGDSGGSGLGAEVTQSLSLDDPTGAKIVRTSVNFLQSALSVFAAFLPDISKFSVTEDIERGISIPLAKMREGLSVLVFYGVPVTVLAYVILRRKEVAP